MNAQSKWQKKKDKQKGDKNQPLPMADSTLAIISGPCSTQTNHLKMAIGLLANLAQRS
jgi:hypothetical protein